MKTMFCAITLVAALLVSITQQARAQSKLLSVDLEKLVARADLNYDKPASRSEEGMPVGNGRMGSLVWTTPTQLKFQLNHVNVYGINGESNSFPERHSDSYASNCGYLDITFVDYGDEVFSGEGFQQHLSLYDGVMTAKGRGVTARVLGWPARDVMAVEITDSRDKPSPISIDLRMLRYAIDYHNGENWELTNNHQVKVRTLSHTTTFGLDIRDNRIALTQQFREGNFYGASALAVAVAGREAQARYQNDAVVRMTAAPGRGKFTILVGAAASFDEKADLAGLALKEVDAAAAKGGFDAIAAETTKWWHDFWARGFVHLHSTDGQADFVEQQYTYFLYLMGSSSHGGAYPPRFGGMLWYTNGNLRAWGTQHWWANTSAYYRNLMPAGRLELMDPMFSMYTGMYDACARAARQQWDTQGIWIPETVWFDGPENLPDDIAAEMRDLYLIRKPWSPSQRFLEWVEMKQPHYSRVNWKSGGEWKDGRFVYVDKGHPPFGHTTHILGVASRIANVYWQRYQFTMDEKWLRERAYPMIKGAAEFYRHYPNFRKDADGKYHIHHVNNGESNWDTPDSPYEVSCMHMIFPLAVRASEILGVDEDVRPVWREIKENLVPTPNRTAVGQRPNRPQAQGQGQGQQRRRGFGAFVYNGEGAIEPLGSEPELKSRFLNFTMLGSFIDAKGSGGAQIFRNRLRLREGPGAIDAEHIGGLSFGIHSCLLDSAPPTEEGEPVLKLFNTWPKEWDAAFALLARGAFVVSSAQRGGNVDFVEIVSRAGSPCQLQNPWTEEEVTLYRNGKKSENLKAALLTFSTDKDEHIVVVRAGTTPEQFKRAILKQSAE